MTGYLGFLKEEQNPQVILELWLTFSQEKKFFCCFQIQYLLNLTNKQS